MKLTVASLFSGIGGFELAFERAGAKTVATVEIDTAAAAIGARHFPHATRFDDVTKVTGVDLAAAGFVPDRGIVTAGWPCQDFSVAGRRAGLAGARSGLWWEVARILAEVRPRWFVGENVPGLLSSVCEPECEGGCMRVHGGAMGSVLGSLAELGYGVAYRVLDAQHFGVPQQRKRVVIVGHLGAPFGAAAQVLLEPESSERDSTAGGQAGTDATDAATGRVGTPSRDVAPALVARPDRRRIRSRRASHRPREAVAALTSNGVGTCGADDNQAQAGHIVVQALVENLRGEVRLTDSAPALSCGGGKPGQGYAAVCVTGARTHTLTSEGADASEDGTGRGTPIVVQSGELAYQCHGSNVGPMGTLRQGNGALTGALTGGVPFVVQPQSIGFHMTQDPISSPERVPAIGANSIGNGVQCETVVRRLTELECERLQGYPDGWTDNQSGSARYRQLGNSIAVPVFEWVARRLIAVDEEIR